MTKPETMPVAHIAELWRYPVKSMRGEQVEVLELRGDGIAGDRRFAIESSGAPTGKPLLTGQERASMLLYAAAVQGSTVAVICPDGTRFTVEDPALLRRMEEALPQRHALRLVRSIRPLTDCRPIAMLSTQTIVRVSAEMGRAVDARRFRANIVLSMVAEQEREAFPEDRFVRRELCLGPAASVRVTERDPRCRVVTLDPETAEPDPSLMKHLDRCHDGRLGIYAATVSPGLLRVGDPVLLC